MKLGNDYQLTGSELEILIYPHPTLAVKAKPIETFDKDLEELAKNMLFTMYNAPGIGLAATQIGIEKRIFVLDVDYEREKVVNAQGEEEYKMANFNPQIFINPVILEGEGETTYQEGCLSLPGIFDDVKRKKEIVVEYQDLSGEKHKIKADDLLSICIQHENDHLDGVMFIDRLSSFKKNFYRKKFAKKKK